MLMIRSRCDRNSPCGACTRHKVECVFNLTHPPRNRHKRGQQQALKDRIKQYEALLLEKGIDPERLPEISNTTPFSASNHVATTGPLVSSEDKVHRSASPPLNSDFDSQESQDQSRYKYANK